MVHCVFWDVLDRADEQIVVHSFGHCFLKRDVCLFCFSFADLSSEWLLRVALNFRLMWGFLQGALEILVGALTARHRDLALGGPRWFRRLAAELYFLRRWGCRLVCLVPRRLFGFFDSVFLLLWRLQNILVLFKLLHRFLQIQALAVQIERKDVSPEFERKQRCQEQPQ